MITNTVSTPMRASSEALWHSNSVNCCIFLGVEVHTAWGNMPRGCRGGTGSGNE